MRPWNVGMSASVPVSEAEVVLYGWFSPMVRTTAAAMSTEPPATGIFSVSLSWALRRPASPELLRTPALSVGVTNGEITSQVWPPKMEKPVLPNEISP